MTEGPTRRHMRLVAPLVTLALLLGAGAAASAAGGVFESNDSRLDSPSDLLERGGVVDDQDDGAVDDHDDGAVDDHDDGAVDDHDDGAVDDHDDGAVDDDDVSDSSATGSTDD